MAKKDKDINKIIELAGKSISPIQTDDKSVTTKSPKELRQERRDAIREQRDVINYTKDLRKKDEYFAGDNFINTAKQNIKTIKDNAKEELKAYNTKVKNDRIARQKGYADEAVGLVADWMERTGQDNIDKQSLATVLSPKQLWYFQKFNNKGSNFGSALGGREFFGELNNNTVSSINQMAKERLGAKQQQEKDARNSDEALKTSKGDDMIVGNVTISNKKINEMKDWGDGITDVNAISPEKVQQLYEKLESYGVAVPKEPVLDEQGNAVVDENNSPVMQYAIGNDNYTIDTILDELDDEGDMVLEALGFRDSQTNRLAVPHHRTYEEILADRQRAQDELRYANEQKALQRQQARLGLADLAAGIGDMIKASGGAIVTPRDYRAMYDSLTEQQKTNYNNYLARMDALKAEQKAKQKEAAEQARQERLLKEQRLYNEQLQQRQWAHDEDVLEQKHQNKLAEIKARGTQKIKEIGERYNNQINKFNNAGAIVFDGIDYTFDKARNTNVISAILPIVRKYFTEENGYLGMLSGIEESVMSEWGKFYETSRMVLGALGDFRNEFSDDDRENIVRVLTEYSNSRKIANAPKWEETTITQFSSEQMYRNKETGEKVSKSEWDTYRPSKKELYEPVTA